MKGWGLVGEGKEEERGFRQIPNPPLSFYVSCAENGRRNETIQGQETLSNKCFILLVKIWEHRVFTIFENMFYYFRATTLCPCIPCRTKFSLEGGMRTMGQKGERGGAEFQFVQQSPKKREMVG